MPNAAIASVFVMPPSTTAEAAATFCSYVCLPCFPVHAQQHLAPERAVYLLPSSHGFRGKRKGNRGRFIPVPELEEPYGRLPGLDIMLHPQINAHKESPPFLMSKKWEAVHNVLAGFLLPKSIG